MTTASPRIGIVVTDVFAYLESDPDMDTPILVEALRERGVEADAVIWHSDTWSASDYDLLVLRSPWDYPERPAEFHDWFTRVSAQTRVVNSLRTVEWNLDKQYLGELERAGVAVVPTQYCASVDEVRAALERYDRDAGVVVKPTVSAGARDTGLFHAGDSGAFELGERIVGRGGIAMIQPEIAELSEGREKALYVIEGTFTHAIAKGALLERGGGFLGGEYVENPVVVAATDAEVSFAAEVLRPVQSVTGEALPLYARVDTVESAEFGLVVLEVELVEPALNLHVASHATTAVVDAILRAAA